MADSLEAQSAQLERKMANDPNNDNPGVHEALASSLETNSKAILEVLEKVLAILSEIKLKIDKIKD